MTGQTISHYQIEHELGRGGMGVVYKARDTRLNRTVAIKVLPAHALASEDDRARFYREAQAAAALSHANIATVYEIDESLVIPTEGGTSPGQAAGSGEPQPFIAMEFVEGESLADRIAKGPLPLKEAISITRQIADGLHAAHTKNIVHRDIKSGNVMLTADRQAKILDFGLAKTAASTRLTNLGSTLGTIAYMSPEQARGEEVDRRTDIWSLGAVLYEMITGRMPFPGDYEQAVVYGILNEEPEPPTALRTGVPMELERIVAKCLAKDADRRYQHVDEVLVDLKRIELTSVSRSTGVATVVSDTSTVPATAASSKPSSMVTAAGGVLLVVGLGVGILLGALLLRKAPDAKRVFRAQLVLPDAASPLQAAITPDDRILYYVAADTEVGVRRLATYNFETGVVRRIDGTDGVHRPVISADGRWVAYMIEETGHLWRMPTSGGEPTEVVAAVAAGFASLAAITPEGELVFGKTGWQSIDRAGSGGQISTVVERDSTRMQQYILAISADPSGTFITWSDFDGSGIPYWSWILREGARQADKLLEGAYVHAITSSGHALFIRGRIRDPQQTLAVPIDLDTGEIMGAEVPIGSRSFPAAVSPSGLLVYEDLSDFVTTNRTNSVYSVNASGEGEFVHTLPGASSAHFSISGDGSMLSVDVQMENERDDKLYLVNMKSRTSNPVSQGGRQNVSSWGPADDYIYFDQLLIGGNWEILRRKADLSGTNEPVFSSSKPVRDVDVSRDGTLIVFRQLHHIWGLDLVTDSSFVIVQNDTQQRRPKLSPDNRFVVYVQGITECGSVRVSSTDGKGESIEIAGFGCHVDWTADGNYIYYEDAGSIYRVAVTTDPVFRQLGVSETVFTGPSHLLSNRLHFDVAADGELYVAYAPERAGYKAGTIWVVNNWFEELNKIAPPSD